VKIRVDGNSADPVGSRRVCDVLIDALGAMIYAASVALMLRRIDRSSC